MTKKRRFGLLDAFILAVLLLSAVGLVLRAQMLHVQDTDEVAATVRLEARSIPPEIADCLSRGERLYTADGTVFGTVEAVERNPSRVQLVSGGATYTGEDAERIDFAVTVTVLGSASEGVLLRNGRYAVLVGETVTLYGERIELSWLICGTSVP